MNKPYDYSRALAEADRCLLCHDAPCSKGCPAGTDPGTFIKKFRMKNVKGAIRTIKENNILGGACGILCPTARLCEKECACTGLDRPIDIGRIQEFLVRHGRDISFNVFEQPEPLDEKVAVIGAGPAGLSCAATLARKGYQVTVFEKMAEPGGVLRYGVPASRFSKELLKEELKDIYNLGIEFECNAPVSGDAPAETLFEKGYQAVFIGTGLWQGTPLFKDPPAGVYSSVEFLASPHVGQLDEVKNRVSGKRVAVIGGGSVAMDCAEYAQEIGAADVFLIYRRSYSQMPAEPDERQDALDNNVHFMLLNQPTGYAADEAGSVTGVKLVRTELSSPQPGKRRTPVEVEGSDWVLEVDCVIEAIGNQAVEGETGAYPQVEINEKNLIKASVSDCTTSKAGIFAGGDIIRGPSLVVNAVQDGKTAAQNIDEYLTQRRG